MLFDSRFMIRAVYFRIRVYGRIQLLSHACIAAGVITNCGICRQGIARSAASRGALKTFSFAVNLCSFFVRIVTARIQALTSRRLLRRTRSHAPVVKAQLNLVKCARVPRREPMVHKPCNRSLYGATDDALAGGARSGA